MHAKQRASLAKIMCYCYGLHKPHKYIFANQFRRIRESFHFPVPLSPFLTSTLIFCEKATCSVEQDD